MDNNFHYPYLNSLPLVSFSLSIIGVDSRGGP